MLCECTLCVVNVFFYTAFCLYVCIFFLCATILVNKYIYIYYCYYRINGEIKIYIRNGTIRYRNRVPINYSAILYRLPDIVTYWSKIAKFLYLTCI